MRVRSLPHFAHKPIGKTTHKKGMSYAHVNYITREQACSKTLAQNMPAGPKAPTGPLSAMSSTPSAN